MAKNSCVVYKTLSQQTASHADELLTKISQTSTSARNTCSGGFVGEDRREQSSALSKERLTGKDSSRKNEESGC